MKSFREFINEETMPFAQTEKGFVGIESPAVRDNINSLIAGVTDCEFITPYIALERVAKVLANFHIFLPKQTFLDSDRGMVTIEINQFGEKVGMQDNGEVVTQASSPYYLYFEYEVDDNGTFEVFSEVVTDEELDEILSDMDEEELDEEKDSEEEKDDEEDDEDTFDTYKADNQLKEESIDEALPVKYFGRPLPKDTSSGKFDSVVKNTLKNAKKKLIAKALKEAEGMHLDKPQKGKMASINKLNKEEKLDEKLTDHQLYMNGAISRDEYEKRTGKGRYKKPDPKERYGVVNKNLVKTVKEEEQIDELSQETKKSYVAKRGSQLSSMKYGSDRNNNSLTGRQQKNAVTGIKRAMKEEQIDELSKDTLGSYIKKASHDVATKSAQVGRYAAASRYGKEKYEKSGRKDIESYRQSKKDDDTANKSFDKSWKRRKFMDKAVDKLTSEENINELSKDTLGSYIKKASVDLAGSSVNKDAKRIVNRLTGTRKAVDKLTKEENLPEAKDSYAAYQRRMGMNPEKAAKKEGEWSKQIKKQEKKAIPKK